MLNKTSIVDIQLLENLYSQKQILPTKCNIKGVTMRIRECNLSYINSVPEWEESKCQEMDKMIPPSLKQKKMKKKSWDLQDEYILFKFHKELGNKWSEIAHHLQGRDDNTVKNYFYCKMRKIVRMLNKGIINDEIRRNEYSVWQALYLLDHVKSNYINPKCKELKGDKYIINMVEKGKITEKTIENYVIFLFNSISPDLKKKINYSETKSLNSDIEYELNESFDKNISNEIPELKKDAFLPLPTNMYNPRFKLQALEDCNYSFLFDSFHHCRKNYNHFNQIQFRM